MCIIICCDKDSGHIKKDMLNSAEQLNPDGMGIAWINKDNKVRWRKGLNSKQLFKIINKVKPSLEKGYIVHARIASCGSVCNQLTHPFEISEDANDNLTGETNVGVLFHNGTWMEYKEIVMKTLVANKMKMYKGENSDSRSMAFLAHMYGLEFLNLLASQKIAVLTPKGIQLFGKFPKVKKHLCSNDYITYTSNKKSYMCGDYDEFDGYNITSYCEMCDRNLKESKFTMNYEVCDDCFKRSSKQNIDDEMSEHFINAKQYMDNEKTNWYNKHDKGVLP